MSKRDSPTGGRRAVKGERESSQNGRRPARLGDLLAVRDARTDKVAGARGRAPSEDTEDRKLASFDAEAFYAALDAARQARDSTWKTVANSSGVSASTLTRIAQGARPDVDSLAALAAWADLDANAFVRRKAAAPGAPPHLAMISTYLKTDPQLTPEAATALDQLIKVAYAQFRKTHAE